MKGEWAKAMPPAEKLVALEDFKAFTAQVEKRAAVIHGGFTRKYLTGQKRVEVAAGVYAAIRIIHTLLRNDLLTREIFEMQLKSLEEQMGPAK